MRQTVLLVALLSFALSAPAQIGPSFEVSPSTAVRGVTQSIILRAADGFDCRNAPIWCGVDSVTVGGVKSPSVTTTGLFAEIRVTLPDLPPGTVADVVVIDTLGNMRRRSGAVRIVDPDAPYSAEAFDRVLIPVIYEGPGQKGSQWTTDVWLMNGSTYDMPFLRGPVAQLRVEESASVHAAAPNGHVLYVAKGATDDLAVNVLARDLSRQSEALGTELPAVAESDFENRRILLLNVPADPKFRLTLRAYALDRLPLADALNYWLYDLESGEQVAFGVLWLSAPADENAPWSASVGDLIAAHPEIAGKGRLRLSISPLRPDPAARFWAFLTVTNNETQHVTAITPNP